MSKTFKSKYAFVPQDPDEIELQVGDTIEISPNTKQDDNWGVGLNTRTNKKGSFPWSYVVEVESAPRLPPKPRTASTSASTGRTHSYENTALKQQQQQQQQQSSDASVPAIQPRGRTSTKSTANYDSYPWYAGPMGRPDVQKSLADLPDGSYLVRTSKSRPGYTLSIKFSEIRHIIIIERGGKFGFSEPTTFASLLDLIKYFQNDSLACYNAELETKLVYPFKEAPTVQEEENEVDVIEEEALYVANRVELRNQMKKGKYGSLPRASISNVSEQDVYVKFKAVQNERRAHRMIIDLLTDQKQLLDRKISQSGLQQADEGVLKENLKKVNRRLVDSERNMTRIDSKAASVTAEKEEARASISQSDDGRRASVMARASEKSYEDKLDRVQAEAMLEGKEDGQYLIRRSNRDNDPFTLSMRFQNKTRHIQIKFDGKRYGLAEPLAFFSIGKLCEYYKTCELSSTITKKLTTCINEKRF